MGRPKKNLNDKPSEYIEKNFLEQNPEGLAPCHTVPEEGKLIHAKYVPPMRKVQFVNGRDPGRELMFHYHSKTHPLKHYTLFHGKEYTLTEEIIAHLEDCAERQYGYRQGDNGHPEMYVKGLKYLYQLKTVRQAA